ncbi:MAG: hypothetical protein J6330_02445 [Clostridia bacterium]|nr:hypothetical protein [Clostridia bacterium]
MKKLKYAICLLLAFVLSVSVSSLGSIKEDFESGYPGGDPAQLDGLYGFFEWNNATGSSACDLVSDGGSVALKISGYSELYTIDYIPGEYVFSLKIKPMKDNGMINVFVRGDMPGGLVKVNPKNAGVNQAFYYFEWDWYAENGGSGSSSVGGSGVVVSLTESGISVRIKRYAKDSLTVTSKQFRIATEEAPDLNAYNDLKITDTGKRIDIYLNGALAAYVQLSDDSVTYDTDGTGIEYYKSATVFDGKGGELGTVENTRLHYKGSQLAVAGRNETFYVDDLFIAYGEHAIEYSNGEYVPETQPVTAAPDTEPDVQTEPQTTAGDPDVQTDDVTTENTEKKGGLSKKAKTVIIAAAADVIIIAALAILIPKKKKQTEDK